MLLSVIIPVYNEQEVLPESYSRFTAAMEAIGHPYELVFVNDGSYDASLSILEELCHRDKRARVVSFSRNFGHQIAVSAGLAHARGDAMVIIDADLQDPPEVIGQMVEKWRQGAQVVYGQRLQRDGETWFKRLTARLFYLTINKLSSHPIPLDTGDFRLIDKRVAQIICAMPEHSRFLRGMIPWTGFVQEPLPYHRQERFAGYTKYPLKKMLKLAYDGICSFSVKPLKLAGVSAVVLLFAAFLYLVVDIVLAATGTPLEALHWLMPPLLAVAALILICIYLTGEYIGRIYMEVQGRPLYIVDRRIGWQEDESGEL